MSNYGIKYIMITNSHKCQVGLHHRDGLIETIKMDIIICLLWSSGVKDITCPIDYGILTSSRRQHPTSPQTGPPAGPTTLGPCAVLHARPTGVNAQARVRLGMDSEVWKSELSVFVSAKNAIMDIRIRIRF
jgi:hypothetical protein